MIQKLEVVQNQILKKCRCLEDLASELRYQIEELEIVKKAFVIALKDSNKVDRLNKLLWDYFEDVESMKNETQEDNKNPGNLPLFHRK